MQIALAAASRRTLCSEHFKCGTKSSSMARHLVHRKKSACWGQGLMFLIERMLEPQFEQLGVAIRLDGGKSSWKDFFRFFLPFCTGSSAIESSRPTVPLAPISLFFDFQMEKFSPINLPPFFKILIPKKGNSS